MRTANTFIFKNYYWLMSLLLLATYILAYYTAEDKTYFLIFQCCLLSVIALLLVIGVFIRTRNIKKKGIEIAAEHVKSAREATLSFLLGALIFGNIMFAFVPKFIIIIKDLINLS